MSVAAIRPESIEAEEAALAAVGAPLPSSSAAPARCSDVALAKRLRSKRLGIEPVERHEQRKVADTLRTITNLILAPWSQSVHAWRELQPEAPKVHRTIGAHVLDFFGDMIVERALPNGFCVPTLDGLDYERAASAMRSEQTLNEVCWFIDGKLAIAWNVIKHVEAISLWFEMADEGAHMVTRARAVSDALSGCVRLHPSDGCEWKCEIVPPNGAAQMASRVLNGDPRTVWGRVRPNVKPEADELALIAALNVRHYFVAYV
jgi:hypothetical protein